MTRTVSPGSVSGSARAPASKSLTVRAVACAAMARGQSEILDPSRCGDAQAAMAAARALGARVDEPDGPGGRILVSGGIGPGAPVVPCGESGACLRMFAPIAALLSERVELVAEGSLARRSVAMAPGPLAALGASCETRGGLPPLSVRGPLRGGSATVDGSESSQFLSGLLMALPLAPLDSRLGVPRLASGGYVDLTLMTMRAFGAIAAREAPDPGEPEGGGAAVFSVRGGQSYRPASFRVEGDWSAAAFLLAAGAIAGGPLRVSGLDGLSLQPDRAVMDALSLAGAAVRFEEDGGGRAAVERGGTLLGFRFDATDCPDLFPPLVALASRCEGATRLRGANRLRGKESDRAAALVEEFGALGLTLYVDGDELVVEGTGRRLGGGRVSSRGDHRIAMALAVAALAASAPVSIEGAECVGKSYPEFWETLDALAGGAARFPISPRR